MPGKLKVSSLAQLNEQEALVCETKYGYKIISLTPDVRKIYIEVTTLCNFDCRTCIRNSWDDGLGHMEYDIYQLLMGQMKDLPELKVVHFGGFGEPMSHPHIFDMIRQVKDLGVRVEMITNGSLLNEEAAQTLIDLGLDKLFISLDGPEVETFNEIRQGADFNVVINNIKAFNKLKRRKGSITPELGIEFVIMKKNYHKLPGVVRLANELEAKQLLVTNVLPYSEELKDEIVYDIDDTVQLFQKDSSMLSMRAQLPNFRMRTERYCNFIENKALTVTWEGQVAPCYALMHGYKCFIYGREKKISAYYYGNVKEKPLREIWTSPDYASFRTNVKEFNFPSCTDCKQLEGCTYPDDNETDCWANEPSCSECLWARRIIVCP